MSRSLASSLLITFCLLAAACYPRLMPADPVAPDEQTFLGAAEQSSQDYSGEPQRQSLVLPFIPWGLDFEEEMLFEFANHPLYGMVEITRVGAADGRQAWFALVSELNGVQHVVVGNAEAAALARVFPAPVTEGGLQVVEVRTDSRVQYRATMNLPNGQHLDVLLSSRSQGSALPKRNGNAMNHSQDSVLVVLDLEEFNWASAEVRLDGRRTSVRKLALVLPFAWRLQQAVGGLASGSIWMDDSSGLAPTLRVAAGVPRPLEAQVGDQGVTLRDRGEILETDWGFDSAAQGRAFELRSVAVRHGQVPVFNMRLNPSLPDLRFPLSRTHESRFVAGSNGRAGLMTGTVRARSGESGPIVEVVPDIPFWACERPVRNTLDFVLSGLGEQASMGVELSAVVDPQLAAGGQGRGACGGP